MSSASVTSKTAHQKAQKVLKELKILKIQQATIEKDSNLCLENLRHKDPAFFNQLLPSRSKIVDGRRNAQDKISRRVGGIQEDISKVVGSLRRAQEVQQEDLLDDGQENRPPLNLERLRADMEQVSLAIERFKQEQANTYEKLLNEFNLHDGELSAMNRRLVYDSTRHKIHDRPLNKNGLRPKTAPATSQSTVSTNKLPEEVTNYQNFLILNGGLNGGWDDFDHNNFIKIYKSAVSADPEKFLETCIINLPGKSIENIKSHRIWYEKFQQLLEDKKKAIENWKRVKEFEKKQTVNNGKILLVNATDGLDDERDKVEKLREQVRKKKEIQRRQKEREEILSWKEQKQLQEQLAQENLRKIKDEERKKKELINKQRSEAQRVDVELYRLEKMALADLENEKAAEKKAAAESEKKKAVAKNLPKFRARNNHIMEKKLLMKEIDSYEEQARARRLEKIKATVRPQSSRDFGRLTQLTKAAQHRQMAERDSVGATVGSRNMPSRSVPSWRAGINL